jgi:hypothetical protein
VQGYTNFANAREMGFRPRLTGAWVSESKNRPFSFNTELTAYVELELGRTKPWMPPTSTSTELFFSTRGFPATVGRLKAAAQALDAIGTFLAERLQAP